jgi:hypothetical protein
VSELADTLRSLHASFDDLQLRWYVFGAQAAILHGVARATADIDVTVDPAARSTSEIAAALSSHGFTLRFSDDAFVAQTRVLPVTHASGVPVDIVLAGPGLEDLFFERLVLRRIGGVKIPVASAEDIIVMKVLAGRAKDLEDVRGILSAKGAALDLETIRETLRLLQGALDQSDLLPLFEQLRARR